MTDLGALGAPARLGVFAGGLVLLFLVAFGVGTATGDEGGPTALAAGHSGDAHPPAPSGDGTSLSAGGQRLDAPVTTVVAGQVTPFSFTVRDGRGAAVTDFDVEQDREMHLVLVDRELRRFAHLHPVRAPDGTWSTLVTLAPGSYRAVADYSVDGVRHALGTDLTAPGRLRSRGLPPETATARVGGFTVALRRDGERVSFDVTRAGRPVDLEDYLGAKGHLVAFRAGDLAYSHVHPLRGTTFGAALPAPGTYRLFFQFKVAGTVHDAPFTVAG